MINSTTQDNWESVFDRLHILMSYDTTGLIDEDKGPQFAEIMKGGVYDGTTYLVQNIKDA